MTTPLNKRLLKILYFIFVVTLAVSLLALVQKKIYPSSVLFFMPQALLRELKEVSWKPTMAEISEVIRHFLTVNIIGPVPNIFNLKVWDTGVRMSKVSFIHSWRYTWIGWWGLILWVFFLTRGIVKNFFSYFPETEFFYWYFIVYII